MTCETCKFYNDGLCRRNPPTLIFKVEKCGEYAYQNESASWFPSVYKDTWCGEYVEKEVEK